MPSRPDPPGGTEGVVWLRETREEPAGDLLEDITSETH